MRFLLFALVFCIIPIIGQSQTNGEEAPKSSIRLSINDNEILHCQGVTNSPKPCHSYNLDYFPDAVQTIYFEQGSTAELDYYCAYGTGGIYNSGVYKADISFVSDDTIQVYNVDSYQLYIETEGLATISCPIQGKMQFQFRYSPIAPPSPLPLDEENGHTSNDQFLQSIANSTNVILNPRSGSTIYLFNLEGQLLKEWKGSESFRIDMRSYNGNFFFFIEESNAGTRKEKYVRIH